MYNMVVTPRSRTSFTDQPDEGAPDLTSYRGSLSYRCMVHNATRVVFIYPLNVTVCVFA